LVTPFCGVSNNFETFFGVFISFRLFFLCNLPFFAFLLFFLKTWWTLMFESQLSFGFLNLLTLLLFVFFSFLYFFSFFLLYQDESFDNPNKKGNWRNITKGKITQKRRGKWVGYPKKWQTVSLNCCTITKMPLTF